VERCLTPGRVDTRQRFCPISQSDSWRRIRGRAVLASILAPIGNHTFSATGITA
jgi:hypothetical protein